MIVASALPTQANTVLALADVRQHLTQHLWEQKHQIILSRREERLQRPTLAVRFGFNSIADFNQFVYMSSFAASIVVAVGVSTFAPAASASIVFLGPFSAAIGVPILEAGRAMGNFALAQLQYHVSLLLLLQQLQHRQRNEPPARILTDVLLQQAALLPPKTIAYLFSLYSVPYANPAGWQFLGINQLGHDGFSALDKALQFHQLRLAFALLQYGARPHPRLIKLAAGMDPEEATRLQQAYRACLCYCDLIAGRPLLPAILPHELARFIVQHLFNEGDLTVPETSQDPSSFFTLGQDHRLRVQEVLHSVQSYRQPYEHLHCGRANLIDRLLLCQRAPADEALSAWAKDSLRCLLSADPKHTFALLQHFVQNVDQMRLQRSLPELNVVPPASHRRTSCLGPAPWQRQLYTLSDDLVAAIPTLVTTPARSAIVPPGYQHQGVVPDAQACETPLVVRSYSRSLTLKRKAHSENSLATPTRFELELLKRKPR